MRCKTIAVVIAVFVVTACFKKKNDSVGVATGTKTLHFALPADIKGFDPLFVVDQYSHIAVSQIYESLLEYDYLKRPYQLKPLLVEQMPQVSEDGKTYEFRLKKGIFFHTDAAFTAPRPLTVEDVFYSYRRFADPKLRHPSWWTLGAKIQGMDILRDKASKNPEINVYHEPIEGLIKVDEKTFRIKLNAPDRQFLYSLAMASTAIVAREVVEKYGQEFLNHPVGTGPFILKKWNRNQSLEFVKNPNYRHDTYPTEGEVKDKEQGLLEAAGHALPFVDELQIQIFVESQPQWLTFLKGKLDASGVPKDAYDAAFDHSGHLKDELAAKKIQVYRGPGTDVVMQVFNMDDPVVGKNPYLRKAVSMAINREKMIEKFYNGRAVVAQGPIPPEIEGYSADMKDPNGYDLQKAKLMLEKAKAHHKKLFKGAELPAVIEDIVESTDARQLSESFKLDLLSAGIQYASFANSWPQFSEKLHRKQIQMAGYAWGADYPDAENFLQLLYGPNESPSPNAANWKNDEFDKLFLEMKNLPDGVQRKEIISKMVKLFYEDCPWVLLAHRMNVSLYHSWLKNYKPHSIAPGLYKYYDLDEHQKLTTKKLF